MFKIIKEIEGMEIKLKELYIMKIKYINFGKNYKKYIF